VPDHAAEHAARGWTRCQEALAVEVDRVAELLRSLPGDGSRPDGVVGDWGILEVAVHLSQVWIAVPGLARGDLSEAEAIVPDRGAGAAVARDVAQLGQVTRAAVAVETVRDPALLATRIETRARDYLADCAGQRLDEHRQWLLGDITVPPIVFTAHLLSETAVHGWDIAGAAGRPWRINPDHAALVVRWFLLELLLHGARGLIGDPARFASVRGRYRFDIRGLESVRLVFDDRGARVDTDPRSPDCRMSLDPVAFLLMFFGRRGLLGTAARGGVLLRGRKPWLGLRLHSALPTP
jgi:uncharacterized protein (TIGR03083 family)